MSTHCPATARTAPAKARLGRKLAALAGATGVVAAGTAEAVPYTPTAGVAAAQGIPSFSFNASTTTATLGSLRPPVTPNTAITWDIDGVGAADFQVRNSYPLTGFNPARLGAAPTATSANQFVGVQSEGLVLSNLAAGVAVNNARPFGFSSVPLTANGAFIHLGGNFLEGQPGQFGFRFVSNSNTYYGWGTLVIDYLAAGRGFQITEAYYNTVPDTGINVGAVPAPVPEPSSIALLAIGAAGVTAWRARRKRAE
jgi:hypothetical protein